MRFLFKRLIQYTAFLLVVSVLFSSCDQGLEDSLVQNESHLYFQNELTTIDNMMVDDPEGALLKTDEMIIRTESVNNKYFSGKAKSYKAYIYNEITQDVSKAYFNYNEALKDLQQTDSSTAKMAVLNNLGLLYQFYGQYDASFDSYKKALELAPDLTTGHLSDVYYNYGIALKLKGDEDSFFAAEEAFTKSLELARQIDYKGQIADVNNQIGMMYKDVKDYDMARIAYRNNIRSYQESPDMRDYVGRSYHGIGVTYMDQYNVEEAVRAFEQALVYKTKSSSIFVTKYDLGTVLMQGGYQNEAIKIWKEALQEKHNKSDIEHVRVYARLSEVLASNGQYQEALGYSLTFNESVNKIVEEEKTYITKNDKVLFEDVIKEYDEFNAPQPFYADIKIMIGLFLLMIPIIYLLTALYYRSKLSKKVSQTVSQIQNEFQHIKVE